MKKTIAAILLIALLALLLPQAALGGARTEAIGAQAAAIPMRTTTVSYVRVNAFTAGNKYLIVANYSGTYYAISAYGYNGGTSGMQGVVVTVSGTNLGDTVTAVTTSGYTYDNLEWTADTSSANSAYFSLLNSSYSTRYLSSSTYLTHTTSATTASQGWNYDSTNLRMTNANRATTYNIYFYQTVGQFDFYTSGNAGGPFDMYLYEYTAATTADVTFAAGSNGSLSGTTSFLGCDLDDTFGTAIPTFPTPVPATDYVFSGWLFNGTVYSTAALSALPITGDATITAQFTYAYADVTFTAGSNGSLNGTTSFLHCDLGDTFGEAISAFPTPIANTNYAFEGWLFNGTLYSTAALLALPITGDAAITAQFMVLFTNTADTTNFPVYPTPGSVSIDKSIIDSSRLNSNGVVQVEVDVKGIPVKQPVDVVIVMDISGSMANTPSGATATKISSAKDAAKEFVRTLVGYDANASTQNYNENRVALVSFSATATDVSGGLTTIGDSTGDTTLSAFDAFITGLSATGGTNYDVALYHAYNILSNAAAVSGYNRVQYVVFMTDGAPGVYNNECVRGASYFTSADTPNNDTTGIVERIYGSASPTTSTTRYLYYQGATSATSVAYSATDGATFDLQISELWNQWVQGTMTVSDWDWRSSTSGSTIDFLGSGRSAYLHSDNIYGALIKGELTSAQQSAWGFGSNTPLDATIYTIGYGLASGSDIFAPIGLTSTQCYAVLDSMASDSSKSINAESATELSAAYATIAGQILYPVSGAVGTDQMGVEFDLQMASANLGGALGTTPTIEIGYWELNSTTYARTTTYHAIETLTFTFTGDVLTFVTSSEFGSGVNCYDSVANTITGDNIFYNFNTETFTVTLEIGVAREVTLKYWVYLTGSMEGTRPAGTYYTNAYANLRYTNYLGNLCELTYPRPFVTWGDAAYTYSYYLVNSSGQPVDAAGTVVSMANRITIGTPATVGVCLNSNNTILGAAAVPTGYALYGASAQYAIKPSSVSGSGVASITDTTATTYIVSPSLTNAAAPTLTDYSATHVAFAVTIPKLSFTAAGAQGHMIHQTQIRDTAALYTDGIRFGVQVSAADLKAALDVGDTFAFGFMVQPTHKLAGVSTASAFSITSNISSVARFTYALSAAGDFCVTNGSAIFCSRANDVRQTRTTVAGKYHYTIDGSTMITWTSAMENAADTDALIELLRAAGMPIFEKTTDGNSFRYVASLLYDACSQTERQARADTEITYGGLFVKRNANGYYTVSTTYQKTNCASRIYTHYNYAEYDVGTTAALNGWSLYAPPLATQSAWQ